MSVENVILPVENLRLGSATERRLKRAIRKTLAVFGYEIYRGPGLTLRRRKYIGLDILRDVGALLGRSLRCMIDGGAHVGETAVSFSDAFPEAVIYSFEPTLRSFEALQHNTRQNPHIRPINAALGPETGRANLNVNNCSQTNSFLKAAAESRRWVPVEWTATTMTQEVTVFALDDFVPNQLGSCVDLLKLDVQGYELMVLQGAKRLLTRGEIPLIYLEICHVPQYREQTSLPDLYDFLYKYGYRLVSIYPIEHDVRANKYRLSSNLLFIQESYGRSKSS